MRGHIKQRSKGRWTIILDIGRDPAAGKRQQQWTTARGTKRDAERKLAELHYQVNSGEFVKPSKLTLGEFLGRWLHDYARPNVGPRLPVV